MQDNYNPDDSLTVNDLQKTPLPTGLNVLTILTIIGCVIALLFSVFGFVSSKSSYDKKDEVMAQMQSAETPKFVKSMMGDPANFEKMTIKSYENRIPILLLSLVAVGLCFAGALQMRKRKKQGYLLYVIGELLPFVTMAFFIGFFALSGMIFMFTVVLAAVFILLYTMQRKHLIY